MAVVDLDISADGRWMVSSSRRAGRVWDLQSEDPSASAERLEVRVGGITDIAIAADASAVYVAGDSGVIEIERLDHGRPSGRSVLLSGHEGPVLALDVSDDGRWLVSASEDRTARSWSLSSDAPWREPVVLEGHEGPVGRDARAVVWELGSGHRPRVREILTGHERALNTVAMSSSGRWVATAGQDRNVLVWDMFADEPGVPVAKLEGHGAEVLDLVFAADGRRLFSCSTDRSVRVWTGDRGWSRWSSAELVGHGDEVVKLALDPDHDVLVSADIAGQLLVWRLDGSLDRPARWLDAHAEEIWALEFDAEGELLLSGGADRVAKLWAARSPGRLELRASLRGHGDTINSASFSLDGRAVATGSRDGTARVWDLDAEHPDEDPRVLELSDAGGIDWVRFGAGSERLFTASGGGSIYVWYLDRRGGSDDRQLLRGHERMISAMSVAAGGELLVTGSYDGTVRVWPIAAASLVELGCSIAGRRPTETELREWLPGVTREPVCTARR